MPCKNKLDASNLSLHVLRGLGLSKENRFLPTNKNHNVDKYVVSTTPFRALRCKGNINYSGRNRHPPAAYVIQVTCQAQNRSRVSVRVRLVRAASIPLSRDINQYTWEGNNMSINAHKPLCSTRATHLRIDPALIPLMGSLHRKQKNSYAERTKPRSNLLDVSNE